MQPFSAEELRDKQEQKVFGPNNAPIMNLYAQKHKTKYLYTLGHKNVPFFDYNSAVSWSFFILFVLQFKQELILYNLLIYWD